MSLLPGAEKPYQTETMLRSFEVERLLFRKLWFEKYAMLGMWDGRVNLSLNLCSDITVAANIEGFRFLWNTHVAKLTYEHEQLAANCFS